ncbi:MAG: C40 family peptidase [Flavobacteriia bacterium]|nr:C40 family peptidase [Flavobacteriia bacterium]
MKNCKQIILICVVLFSINGFGQIPVFDKMEMLYAQQHYKLVFRKANNLLNVPDYDYSMIPTFYKSISLFQLCQNELYFKKHPDALKEAKELFILVKKSNDGKKIFTAHQSEIVFLKSDLLAWIEQLKKEDRKADLELLQLIMRDLFSFIPTADSEGEINEIAAKESPLTGVLREDIVNYAKQYIGAPYLWAGTNPKGFDCSGYTGFVLKEFKIQTQRRAVDMQKECVEVKRKNAQKGDLVFFDNGSGISHVGMIISEKGEPLVMIHASSSKGVIITDLEKSEYWLNRIHSFGTYIQ